MQNLVARVFVLSIVFNLFASLGIAMPYSFASDAPNQQNQSVSTVTYQNYSSLQKEIIKINDMDKTVIQAVYGTEKTAKALQLPQQVGVTLQDGSSILVDAAWDLANAEYDPALKQAQIFKVKGSLTNLPVDVTNTLGLTMYVTIEVGVNNIKAMENISPITIANGTMLYDWLKVLPEFMTVLLDDNSSKKVDLAWDIYNIPYEKQIEETQVFSVSANPKLPYGVTNNENLKPTANVTVASVTDSTYIVKSVELNNQYYEIENETDISPESVGLPTYLEVTLGNESKINANVIWGITPVDGNEKSEKMNYYAYGRLANLPEGVTDPGFRVRVDISTYAKTDIKQVPYLNVQATNGTAKTVEALGLPSQVEVTLYGGSKVNVPVMWDFTGVTYDPTIKTPQTFIVRGIFNSLPSGVTNSKSYSVYANVTINADHKNLEIITTPTTLYKRVPVRSDKTVTGLGLPAQTEVTLSDNSRIYVDVRWVLETVSYDPASNTPQNFLVSGTLVNLPTGVYNSSGYFVWANVITESKRIIDVSPISKTLQNGVPKTVAGLELPAQVEVTLHDSTKVNVNVTWNVYGSSYRPDSWEQQYLTVQGTLTNLPEGVANYGYNAQAYITVSAHEGLRYVNEIAFNPQITTPNGVPKTAEGLGLPAQVEVELSDQSKIKVDVSWNVESTSYEVDERTQQYFVVYGTLVNLPTGVVCPNWLRPNVNVRVAANPNNKEIVDVATIFIKAENGAPKTAEGLGLPAQVEVTLSDNSKTDIDVSWNMGYSYSSKYDPSIKTIQSFDISGSLVNLPVGIYNTNYKLAWANVVVEADTNLNNIVDVPKLSFRLPHGTAKSVEAIGLPPQVEVTLYDHSKVMLNVDWDQAYNGLSSSSYDPLKKDLQCFNVTGYFNQLPAGVYNEKGETIIASVCVFADSSVGKNIFEIPYHKFDVHNNFDLPAKVEVLLENGSTTLVNVSWSFESWSFYNIIRGTLEPTGGITNNWNLKAPFIFREWPTRDTVAKIVHVENASVKVGNPLPTQVNATLDDGRIIPVTICWENGVVRSGDSTFNIGVLCGVPEDVSSSYSYTYGFIENKNVVAVQQFPQTIRYSEQPRYIKAILEDATQIEVGVCWYIGNFPPGASVIIAGTLCDLPAGVSNPYKLHTTGTFKLGDESTTDPYDPDIIDVQFAYAFQMLDDLNALLGEGVEAISNVMMVSDVYTLLDPDSTIFDKVLASLNFIPIGRIIEEGKLIIILKNTEGKFTLRGVQLTEETLDASKSLLTRCNCFVAGTKVQTDEGEKNIEDIQVGDKVLSKDEVTGEVAYKKVTATFNHETDEIYKIHVGGQTIESTFNHPFYVEGKGWTYVKDLKVGDLLVQSDGNTLEITSIELLHKHVKVYNMTVDGFHTYFVSDLGIWVHNTNCSVNSVTKLLDKMPEFSGSTRERLLSAVQNKDLRSTINELYREGGVVGDGGTAAILTQEFFAGSSKHLLKAQERLDNLNNLAKSGKLGLNDLDILDALRDDLEAAIRLFN
ncbi:HINT domain-containing protein [Paenibacillus sp. MER 180]|uniref:Ig-like domain-containing protein n=1 Tax=Paenibacillus sp. MER 180 TaxID=2939570 RepID=UPI00203B0BB0|nr:Ig-like domain-containing protein [Paenibacillus sp. MER 180]MCM3293460.1 HINT domain-containing protein [Paenibacillus sp. MER 180]